jgi:hypothetical protein
MQSGLDDSLTHAGVPERDAALTSRRANRLTWSATAPAVGCVLLALYLAAVWYDWLPLLRGWRLYPEGWTWPLNDLPPWPRFVPAVAIAAAVWALVLGAERASRAAWFATTQAGARALKVLFLSFLVLLGYAWQLALLGFKSDNPYGLIVQRVSSRHFTSYFSFAAGAPDLSTLFTGYLASTGFCLHCQGHPPGASFFYWLVLKAASLVPAAWQHSIATKFWSSMTSDSRMQAVKDSLTDEQTIGALAAGTLLLLLAAAVVAPLFGIARLLGADAYKYRLAALGIALPGLMLMAPLLDQVYATVTASVTYLALRALGASGPASGGLWAAGAGAMLAIGMFGSWGLAVLLMALALLGFAGLALSRGMLFGAEAATQRLPWTHILGCGTGLVAGMALVLSLLEALAPFDLAAIFAHNLSQVSLHEAQRPYLVWVFLGPLDFLQFLGLPLAVATLTSLRVKSWTTAAQQTQAVQALPAAHPHPPVWYSKLNIYAATFLLLTLAIDLAGKTRGEQGRILIFLTPLSLTALFFWTARNRPRPIVLSLLFFAQVAICLTLGARWLVP